MKSREHFLTSTNILIQFGFRSGYSTSDPVLLFIDHCGHSLDKRVHTCSNCNELNNIISPFSLEAVECEHLLFC